MRCVPAHDFTVAKVTLWRSALDERPPYQRESAAWSLEKRQLFVDSLLNGYDVPKIYLHDLRGQHPTKVYAVVDGKQRLDTIWRFLGDEFPLAADFRVEEPNLPELPPGATPPHGGARFSQLDPVWQEVLKTTFLSVVLIQNATVQDIEELFYRLNNGEPLNDAERRNALGGDLAALIREVAGRPFLAERLAFPPTRYQHLDVAARLLQIEEACADGTTVVPDLRSGSLDALVLRHRALRAADRAALVARLDRQLAYLCRVFTVADPLLSAQWQPPLYHLFVRSVTGGEPEGWAPEPFREFLAWFETARRAQLERPAERPDALLAEYSGLVQQGANNRGSLERRVQILTHRFSEWSAAPAPAGTGP